MPPLFVWKLVSLAHCPPLNKQNMKEDQGYMHWFIRKLIHFTYCLALNCSDLVVYQQYLISLSLGLHRRWGNWQEVWWTTSSQLSFSISSPIHPSISSSLRPSPLALLIPSMHNITSPGQARTGGRSGRPDPETKHSLPFECPPPRGRCPPGRVPSAELRLLMSC